MAFNLKNVTQSNDQSDTIYELTIYTVCVCVCVQVKVKVQFTLEQATTTQRVSRCTALLFL